MKNNMGVQSLREIIKQSFKIDLPISGGNGQSIDDAIIIDVIKPELFLQIQQKILSYIHGLGKKRWRVEKQVTINKNGKVFDKQQVLLSDDLSNYHNFYFDITKFPHIKDKDFKKYPRLVNEIDPRDVVFRINFTDKKQKEKEPFSSDKCPVIDDQLKIWDKLFTGKITEEQALEEITQLMEEYYGFEYELDRGFNH